MHISYILSYKKKLVSALLAPPTVAYASIVLREGVDVKRETRLLLFFIFTILIKLVLIHHFSRHIRIVRDNCIESHLTAAPHVFLIIDRPYMH